MKTLLRAACCCLLLLLLTAGPRPAAAAGKPGAKRPPAAGAAAKKQGGELSVGDLAPTRVQLRDLDGKVVDLGLLCGPLAQKYNPRRPKALLADFYMTTCVPCNAALPTLGQLAEEFRAQGLKTVLVSLDGTEHAAGGAGVSNEALGEKVTPARLQGDEVVRDPGRVLAEDFGIVAQTPGKGSTVSVPRTFVIDDQCKVRGVYANLIDNRETVEQLIGELLGAAAAPAGQAVPAGH